MRFAWQGQGFRSLRCRCLKPPTQNPWKGCNFHATEDFAWQVQEFVCLGSTVSWQAQYFWSIHLKIVKTYWNSEVEGLVNLSFLKEVSQKCIVFDFQSFVFEGNLAQKLCFLSFKASFLKKVSQKSFVFDLQSFIFEGIWRKSRTKASFLSFKVQSFIFEGSLAEMLRFWSSKLRFWRKSRTKASFLWEEVSQKCFVFDLQSFVFEGSLAEQLQSVSQSVIVRSISQSVSPSVSQSVRQIVSQSANQSVR